MIFIMLLCCRMVLFNPYLTPDWRSKALGSRRAYLPGVILVIFDPWIPTPPINPFWLKIKA